MSLNKLLELQRQQKAATNPESSAVVEPPASAAEVVPESEAMPPAQTPAPTLGKLPFGNQAKPKPAAPTPKPETKPTESLSLDNLGSFDLSTFEDSEVEETPSEFAGFHDEIEATAPDRDLPEDLEPAMRGFVESLDSIYEILNDSEMFGQQIRQIMMELQENPEYEKLISDTDVHVMIRAMRNTMGLARVKKQAKQRKAATGTKAKSQSKKQALVDKALGLALDFDVD